MDMVTSNAITHQDGISGKIAAQEQHERLLTEVIEIVRETQGSEESSIEEAPPAETHQCVAGQSMHCPAVELQALLSNVESALLKA